MKLLVRTVGIARAKVKIGMANLAYNFTRLTWLQARPVPIAWTVEQEPTMLRDAFGLGGSVRASIERHEVSSGLLYTWRRQAMSEELAETQLPAPTCCPGTTVRPEPTPSPDAYL